MVLEERVDITNEFPGAAEKGFPSDELVVSLDGSKEG